MDNKKLSIALASLTGLLTIGLLASVFSANKLLTTKSVELSKLKAQSQVADELQISLKKNKADIIKYTPLNTIAEMVVPQVKN